jgi:outer membrane autotransporter protein
MEYDELPICNAWVNAEGDRHELRASGTAAGYTLSSWGATVGADFDFSPTFTAGLAMTGMYGELSGRSPDDAHGDTDIYYISMLARYVHHRWTHTWLGTFGWGNISLRRQVNWEGGGYRTKGNTDSTSFGAMYELGYVIPLDEDNQSCLQPVANISYRYAHVDAYAENGSDAALHMGAQSMDGVSFGLGARMQTYALENEMNRQALLEARMLVKMDAGERRNACDVALNALRARSGRVHSAEEGWVGMEIGAGVSIPIGVNAGFLFLDAGFEFRADATDWNGTVGYRFTF